MFNLYKDGLDLEYLRRYCMEQGEERLLKRGEIFEDAGSRHNMWLMWSVDALSIW